MPAAKKEKTYVVVRTTNCPDGQGKFHVRGKAERDELRDILLGLGSDVMTYPEGYFPEFDDSGVLK